MKKALALTLVVLLLTSMPVMASLPFSDIDVDFDENHWAYDAVTVLYAAGLLRGYPDGTLKIRQEMTRAEAIRLVADTFMYLNDRIDALKGQDTTFGDTEETATYLRTIVQEALTEKLGYQVDKRTIDEIIASIAEMKQKFDAEKELIDAKFLDIDGKFVDIDGKFVDIDGKLLDLDGKLTALESQLADYYNEIEALKQSHKADLEKIKEEYTSELNKIRADMAGLEASIAELKARDDSEAVDSLKKDLTAAMEDIAAINKKLDKYQLTGSSEVLIRKVEHTDNLPTDGVFDGFSVAQAFRHELNLNLDVRPDDDVYIGVGMKAINDFSGPGVSRPFDLQKLHMIIDAPDFRGEFGDMSPVTLSDLVLKDYQADGMKITGKTGVFNGAQVLALEDRNNTGKYVVGVTGNMQLSDTMTAGVTFAEIFNGITKTVEDKVLLAFGEAKVLDESWTVKGEMVSAGINATTDTMAARVSAEGSVGGIDTKLAYTTAGASYAPFDLQGNKAKVDAGKGVFTGDFRMPVDALPGLTARAGIELSKGTVDETITRIGANYKTKLADMDGTVEIDLERESKGNQGRNLGFIKAVWNEPIQNSVLTAGYAIKPVTGTMDTERETSLAFTWEMLKDLKLGAEYISTPSKTTTLLGLDYGFMLGSFNAGIDVDVKSSKLASEANPTKDSVVNLTLGRKLSPSTGVTFGWQALSRVASDGTKSSANVTSASFKVDF